jgi:hypothetical protein
MDTTQDWFHAMVLCTGFLDRYPHFAPLLGRFDVVDDASCVMAVSPGGGDRVRLHVDCEFFQGRDVAFRAVLQHELHHVIAGHLDESYHKVAAPDVMQVAKEITANENIVEPLPGAPHQWQDYAQFGVQPGQDTWRRYELLLAARADGRWKPPVLRLRCCPPREGDVVERHTLPAELQAWLDARGAGRDRGRASVRVGAPAGAPEVDWITALQRVACSRTEPHQSMRRPNRRDPQCRRIGELPGWGRRPARARLLVALDTSGSMPETCFPRIAAELQGIARRADVTVVECDAAIQREYAFKGALTEIKGRGGTDLRPVFARDLLARLRPDCVVYFTDGDGTFPAADPGVRTLWVLTSRKPFGCRWGQRVYIDGGAPPPQRDRVRDLVQL